MKTVILCGGEGTRLREYTEEIPKPLVEIGGKPILWHIMKMYAYHGFREFILCLGYKGEKIKEYFLNYQAMNQDFRLSMQEASLPSFFKNQEEDWEITFVNTGRSTPAGGRIKMIEPYLEGEATFMATYADGLSDIDLNSLIEFHKRKGRLATLTAVNPVSQFGLLDLGEDSEILKFKEKPLLNQWINGGFFVFNKEIFSYLSENDVLEQTPFERLAAERKISAYKHDGFWKCMDTYKDNQLLNEAWNTPNPGWKVW